MILKSLRLENIRSYTEQTVNFPMGITLFEGDIGSGKSTILMAIEFALFGLGSEKGGALLKAGAKKGLVTLCFEVDGKEYDVCRSLQRKAKGVQQSDCSLKTEGTVLQLSASEMKEKILDILAFNEPPDPKAGSVIFRYAIFTPQEEMKAIIWMRADQRLQTLRKAFRIEDYRIALDNSSALAKSIREKSIRLASYASDLDSYREKHKTLENEIEKCGKELVRLDEKKTYFDKKTTELRKTVETLQKTKDSIGKAVGEVPLLKKEVKDKSGEIVSLENDIQEIALETVKLHSEVEKLGSMQQPTTKTDYELKDELRLLRAKQQDIISAQGAIDAKIVDYESVEQNKVCPTCDRPADPKEFEEKIKLKKEEKSRATDEASVCETRIGETENLRESLREYQRAQDNLQNLSKQIERNNDRTRQNREKVQKLTEQVKDAQEKLERAEKGVEEFNRISVEAEALSNELNTAERELKNTEINIFGTQKGREAHTNQAKELEIEIQRKERDRKATDRMKEYQMWLEEYLMPTLEVIETQVMMNINQEFNQHFQKWWGMLVEDPSKESRIDEEFTPLVEQDGYEQDYNYLSGGEKTSLALAYRLSLNTIVQKVSAGIKSNLLILDEPTDGFSKEQLFKIREILDELKCPQVIMVSHEKELESFAHQVMRIEKKNGISQINPI
jgi:exonuclease SbcC